MPKIKSIHPIGWWLMTAYIKLIFLTASLALTTIGCKAFETSPDSSGLHDSTSEHRYGKQDANGEYENTGFMGSDGIEIMTKNSLYNPGSSAESAFVPINNQPTTNNYQPTSNSHFGRAIRPGEDIFQYLRDDFANDLSESQSDRNAANTAIHSANNGWSIDSPYATMQQGTAGNNDLRWDVQSGGYISSSDYNRFYPTSSSNTSSYQPYSQSYSQPTYSTQGSYYPSSGSSYPSSYQGLPAGATNVYCTNSQGQRVDC
jgi:hypothetical protein